MLELGSPKSAPQRPLEGTSGAPESTLSRDRKAGGDEVVPK